MTTPQFAGPYYLPSVDTTNPSTIAATNIYGVCNFAISPVIGRDDFFSYSQIGTADHTYYSTMATVFKMESVANIRTFNKNYTDRSPISGVNFGDEFVFQIGKEGLTIIHKLLLSFTLPGFGTTNTAGAGDMLSKYKDYVALFLLGGFQRGPGAIRAIYSNNTIRTMDADAIHFKKLLALEKNSTQEQCYQMSAQADAETGYTTTTRSGVLAGLSTRQPVTGYYEIDMPFGRNKKFGNMLIASALPDTFEIRFIIPPFLQLIEADVTTANEPNWLGYQAQVAAAGNWAVASAQAGNALLSYNKTTSIVGGASAIAALKPVNFFIRIQGYGLMKTERAALSSSVYTDKGASHMTFDHEMSVDNFPDLFTSSTTANTIITSDLPIKNIKNPSAYYIHAVRNTLSTSASSDAFSITIAPGGNLIAAIAAAGGLQTCIAANNRFYEIYPVAQYALLDEQKLATELHSDFYFRVRELADRYECKHDIIGFAPVLIPHSMWMLVEEHGLGHLTNINMIQPSVRLVYTAFPFTLEQDPRGLLTPTVANGPKGRSVLYNNFRIPINNASWNALLTASVSQMGKIVVDHHSAARNIFRQRRGECLMNYK